MSAFAPAGCRIEGHAIASADGMICDHAGDMPAALRSDVDWDRFQAALDAAAVVVLGREGHARHPARGRRRLVFTSAASGVDPDQDDTLTTRFNPDRASFDEACHSLGITSGVIAITGGTRVFDYFRGQYDSFVLVETNGFVLPGGRPCFTGLHPREALARDGLFPATVELLEPDRNITSTLWRRPG